MHVLLYNGLARTVSIVGKLAPELPMDPRGKLSVLKLDSGSVNSTGCDRLTGFLPAFSYK